MIVLFNFEIRVGNELDTTDRVSPEHALIIPVKVDVILVDCPSKKSKKIQFISGITWFKSESFLWIEKSALKKSKSSIFYFEI